MKEGFVEEMVQAFRSEVERMVEETKAWVKRGAEGGLGSVKHSVEIPRIASISNSLLTRPSSL